MSVLSQSFLTPDNVSTSPLSDSAAQRSTLAADGLRASGRLRLQVRGESMLPTLWPGDVVEIARSALKDVQPGEIVLAFRDGRFFLHRLLARTEAGGFLLRGDSMPRRDPEFPSEALVGRLVGRAGRGQDQAKARSVRSPRLWSWTMGRLLCHCGPARRLALKIHSRRKQTSGQIRSAGDSASLNSMDLGTL